MIVETLDYINKPPDDTQAFIVKQLSDIHGYRISSEVAQWVRLPDKKVPYPAMPDFVTRDGVRLQRIGSDEHGHRLYAAYDAMAIRIFWMLAETGRGA